MLRKSGKGAKKPKVNLTDRKLGQELGQDLGGPTCPLCDKGVLDRQEAIGRWLEDFGLMTGFERLRGFASS